jgi:hypothetical protein
MDTKNILIPEKEVEFIDASTSEAILTCLPVNLCIVTCPGFLGEQ